MSSIKRNPFATGGRFRYHIAKEEATLRRELRRYGANVPAASGTGVAHPQRRGVALKLIKQLSPAHRLVLVAAALLLSVWATIHIGELTSDQNGVVRFPLCVFLAALILLARPPGRPAHIPAWVLTLVAGGGAALTGSGLALNVGLFQWTGLILVLLACLLWACPSDRRRNAALSMLLLFWAHPLPSQVFAPLQFAMQQLSVSLSEWFLHVCNVRVWADGLVLNTGVHIYEVPAWCSGMRTATTVALVALGLGFLKRLTLFRCFLLVVAALLQALFLNVLRISAMIVLAPRLGDRVGVMFLHDTAGIIMVAGVVLVYIELTYLEHIQRQRAAYRNELNPFWMYVLSEHPPIWRIILHYRALILAGIFATLLAAVLLYRSRPSHRAEMIKAVVEALRDTRQLSLAEKAARQVGLLVPHDNEWKLTILRLNLIQGEYQRVLDGLDHIPNAPAYTAQIAILRAYAYMGLGDLQTAALHLKDLPESTIRTDPRVAMILAEMARFSGDPDSVALRIITAAQWAPNIKRLRLLYPYLRVHRKWDAIVSSDALVPYTDAEQALCAVEASMNLNMVPRVAGLTLEIVRAWPHDPRILEPLFFLSSRNAEGDWERRFEERLLAIAERTEDPDSLFTLQKKCYQLSRPDLAWQLHRRIRKLDATHPGLLMDAVDNARKWFTFRKRALGIAATQEAATADLRMLYRVTSGMTAWSALHPLIPNGHDLCAENTVDVRKAVLAKAVEEFQRRREAGSLSLPMLYLFVKALEMSGDIGAAESLLLAIPEAHPEQKGRAKVVLSEIHERRGDWQAVYEVLRNYLEETDNTEFDLGAILRLAQAQVNLKLGVAAMHTAARARELFPTSTQALESCVMLAMRFDSPEEALALLEQPRVRDSETLAMLEAVALHRSQRFSESRRLCRSALLPPIPIEPGTMQRPYMPPAEVTMLWHQLFVPSEAQFAANAIAFADTRSNISSPFLEHLRSVWQRCYEKHGEDGSADLDLWLVGARNDTERATLLNQLMLLLCRDQKYTQARDAALKAVEYLPSAPLLWRAAISLSGPDVSVVRRARDACPRDSEIWLAELVLTTQAASGMIKPGVGDIPVANAAENLPRHITRWVDTFISQSIQHKCFTVGAFTRAGNYLQRGGYHKAACAAAWYAADNARGLLPAYVLGLRCAIEEKAKQRALTYTSQAIDASLRPPALFYEKLVGLKSASDPIDTDGEMVEALKVLRQEDPTNPLWAQMLGYVRFQRGGWEIVDSLYQMSTALEFGATNRTPYIVGAEAARLLDRLERSTDLLRSGLQRYPDDIEMLNNLTYTLALTPGGVEEALNNLTILLQKARENPVVLDTASAVYTRSGLLDDADRILGRILGIVEPGSRAWFRARVRAAEVLILRKNYAKAANELRDLIRQASRMSDEDVLAATRFLQEAEQNLDGERQSPGESPWL